MIKKALIIVPPVRISQRPSRFPLGLGYVAASLEWQGVEVSVLDLNILRLPEADEEKSVARAIQGADLVGMGGMITMLNTISRLTSYIKKHCPRIPVIVGGPFASNLEELVLRKTQIDILAKGEGEIIAPELASVLPDKTFLKKVPGLAFLENGKFVQTSPASRIQDLNLTPFPAYHLFPFETYIQNRGILRSADIIGSRGCPYKCTFCFRNFGNKVAFRSVGNILSEIAFLKDIYQIEHVYLEDELFVQHVEFMRKFCSGIRGLGGVTWGACARVDTLTLDLLKEMKASGCMMLMIGIESFSEDRLREMNKKIWIEQIKCVCRWMNQEGIEISPGLIIGMPGETKESVRKTIEGCIRYRIPITKWTYAFATPYPGTKLYSDAREAGRIKDDWEYIQRLCQVGDTCDLAVNLTEFPDEELIRMRDKAIKVATRYLRPFILRRAGRLFGRYVAGVGKRYPQWKRKLKILSGFDLTPFKCVSPVHFRDDLDVYEVRKLFKKAIQMAEIEVFSFCNRQCWFCPNIYIDRKIKNAKAI